MAGPNEAHVLMLLAMLAEQSGEVVSQTRLEYLSDRIIQLGSIPTVCVALEKLLESSRRFPTIAEVREMMGISDPTSRDAALILADRVLAGVAKYGELQPGNVKGALAIERALGTAAWELVQRQGGWNTIVDRAGEGGTFKAQLRDVADSYLKTGAIRRDDVTAQKLPSYCQALEAVRHLEIAPPRPMGLLPDPDTEEPPF